MRLRECRLVIALRVLPHKKARETAAFSFICIHRKSGVAEPPGMRDVINATAEGASVPRVVKVKCQRRVNLYGWLQTLRRLPRPVANTCHPFAVCARWPKRNSSAVACNSEPLADEPVSLYLEALQ